LMTLPAMMMMTSKIVAGESGRNTKMTQPISLVNLTRE
jgi:hypothetical protein